MSETGLLPNLFRTEYQKLVAVLCSLFGIEHIEVAEDLVSDTFLTATETWSLKGVPDNPVAWLYTVAKNKTRNYLKHNTVFRQKLTPELIYRTEKVEELEIDLSKKNIADSQLAMIFTVCTPLIPGDAQVALALNLLCGFGFDEIADAFLTNKEVVYKRISRAKEKLREANIKIEQPSITHLQERLDNVLKTLYLMFSEGYYSTSQHSTLRKEVCAEAMRLTRLLMDNVNTARPAVAALLALMCFHASRFEARINGAGEQVLYDNQDKQLWDQELIAEGTAYLNKASTGTELSKYHLEAGIAYWHTQQEDTPGKWEQVLQLYNQLLILQYSAVAALNRTFALSKARGKEQAIAEAERLDLKDYHFYYSLLGYLYTGIDDNKARTHFETALRLARSAADKAMMQKHIDQFDTL